MMFERHILANIGAEHPPMDIAYRLISSDSITNRRANPIVCRSFCTDGRPSRSRTSKAHAPAIVSTRAATIGLQGHELPHSLFQGHLL